MSTLFANGNGGQWTVDIGNEEDEAYGVPWSITITHPSICLQMPLQTLDSLKYLVEYLINANPESKPFCLGHLFRAQVLLNHYEGRLEFKVLRDDAMGGNFPDLLEVTFEEDQIPPFVEALNDAVADCSSDEDMAC